MRTDMQSLLRVLGQGREGASATELEWKVGDRTPELRSWAIVLWWQQVSCVAPSRWILCSALGEPKPLRGLGKTGSHDSARQCSQVLGQGWSCSVKQAMQGLDVAYLNKDQCSPAGRTQLKESSMQKHRAPKRTPSAQAISGILRLRSFT